MTKHLLCHIDDVTTHASNSNYEVGSSAFQMPLPTGQIQSYMVIRKEGQVFVYLNACPHVAMNLDFRPGQLLTKDGAHIICSNHAALFRIEDGFCLSGPCAEKKLTAVSFTIENDAIFIEQPQL